MIIFYDRKRTSEFGKRSAASRRNQLYCIEGDYVTLTQMAERLGLPDAKAAYAKLYKARKLHARVTWESLK